MFGLFEWPLKTGFTVVISFLDGQLFLSADNLCKQFGPRSVLMFYTLIVFLKEFFEKIILKKSHQMKYFMG